MLINKATGLHITLVEFEIYLQF